VNHTLISYRSSEVARREGAYIAVLGETTILSTNLNFCHSFASSAGLASTLPSRGQLRIAWRRRGEREAERLTGLKLNEHDDEERETDRGRDR
jgi:hypothetical protein